MTEDYTHPFPRAVRIEPAAACNLTCSHCPTGTVEMERGLMSTETFARVMESLQANQAAVKVAVLYHGGEPLLNKGFIDMVKQVKAAGVPLTKTVTNGMVLTDKMIAGIIESGLDVIEFSLAGATPEENNMIRRDSDYATVVKNVKRLIDYKRQQQSITPTINVSAIQFLSEEQRDKDQRPLLPSAPEYLYKEFGGDYEGTVAGLRAFWAYRWPHMEILEDIYELYEEPADSKSFCDHVVNTITVRSNGDVVACCFDLTSLYVLGNVNKDSLATIWNNSRYQALRRSIAKKQYIPMCDNCSIVKPNVFLTLKPEARARACAGIMKAVAL